MTNARTMGNVRTSTVRTSSYNNRKKLNTGSGRTGRTVKMKDGRTASAGRTGRAVSADSVRNGGGRKRNARSGSRMSSQTVRKSSGADRTGTMRAAGKSRAGAAALTVGRTMTSPANAKAVSVRTKKNRTKALEVDRTYVMFLAVMCLLTVFVCVRYLQLKEIITTQTRTNTKLTAELDTLRNENDALLENVTNEIDLDHIRDVAINELGMKYATEDQIVWYTTEDREYVHQFEDVPSE